ncbi:hypothetical protein L1987_66176 [Smallanthus sonchifolius]|uniref:Uncharacterized protein n=1 Tax=Smallanthus sonchifolius TaxID=185202 RepID=A0ACB9BWE5_9ASTR|nr:hypothetical protein L1987_66176 [Smallanthus sonchifolius]
MSNSSFPSTDPHLSFNDFLDNILVDFPSQNSVLLPSRFDNSTRNTHSSSSGSDDGETNKSEGNNHVDERKRKRLISNRESAKRSRMRKQKHLENLTNQVTRYQTVNQELVKRLRFVNHNGQMVRNENQRLQLEAVRLQQKLCSLHKLLNNPELHHPLLPSAWPCNNNFNVTTINGQDQPTLITF